MTEFYCNRIYHFTPDSTLLSGQCHGAF